MFFRLEIDGSPDMFYQFLIITSLAQIVAQGITTLIAETSVNIAITGYPQAITGFTKMPRDWLNEADF